VTASTYWLAEEAEDRLWALTKALRALCIGLDDEGEPLPFSAVVFRFGKFNREWIGT